MPDNDRRGLGSVLTTILDWLTAGYPDGVPPQDRFALLAMMRPRLTDEQVEAVAVKMMADSGDLSKLDAQVLITKVTNELPSEEDVERVRQHFLDAGIALEWESSDASDEIEDGSPTG